MGLHHFILGTDGSQEGEEKYFPIFVRSLDIATGCVKTSLLARSESAAGENIFQLLKDELKSCTPTYNCFYFYL